MYVICIFYEKKGNTSEFWSKSDYYCNLNLYLVFIKVEDFFFVEVQILYKFYGSIILKNFKESFYKFLCYRN